MSIASRIQARDARDAVAPIISDLARPGVAELLGAGLATLVLVGAALAGLSNATGRPSEAGVSLAVSGWTGGKMQVTVSNATTAPFRGTLVVAGDKPHEVAVGPGASSVVKVVVPEGCEAPVHVTLDGRGAPAEPVDLPCPVASP